MRFSLVWLSTVLLMSFVAHPAIATKLELPKIQTDCKTYTQVREKIYLPSPFPGAAPVLYPSPSEATRTQDTIENLLRQKRWNEAKLEIEKLSYPQFRDEMRLKFIKLVSEAQEIDHALKLVMELFPRKQSPEQAQGIGIISSVLILDGQLDQALEVLKSSSHDASSAAIAVLPVIRVILNQERTQQLFLPSANPDQLEKIRTVIALFPGSTYQEKVWDSIGKNIALEPRIANKIAELIQDQALRSRTLDRFTEQWIDHNLSDRFGGLGTLGQNWQAANRIQDCVIRSRAFLDIANFLVLLPDFSVPSYQLDQSEKAQMLDQLEALINAIDEEQIGDRRISALFRLKLVQINATEKRETQSMRLLERVTRDQRRFQYSVDRVDFLLAIAGYYRFLGKTTAAVRTLEMALSTIQSAYFKKDQSFEDNNSFDIEKWREEKLFDILYQYESLRLPDRAAKIRQMLK